MPARLRTMLLDNWPIKLTALVLSALLWVGVAAEQPTSQVIPVTLDVTPPSGRALTQALPPVRALIRAPAREIAKLYGTSPSIHRMVPDSVSSSRYLLDLSPGDVQGAGTNATIEDVQPRSIVVILDDRARPAAARDSGGGAAISERVLMGVPVGFGDHTGWESDPPAVIVTVRGPAGRLPQLTRDSLTVIAVPLGRGTPETVRLDVIAPSGMTATATPDTAVVLRRPRG